METDRQGLCCCEPLYPWFVLSCRGCCWVIKYTLLQALQKTTSSSSTCSKQAQYISISVSSHLANSWSKSQVKARSHPNVLASQDWLNSLYHVAPSANKESPLDKPLVYADRLRIRHPGPERWLAHPPHIDGAFYMHLFHLSASQWCVRWRN